jgi:hypothetical protein
MYDCTLQCLRYLPLRLKPSSLAGWSTAPLKRYSTHLFNLHPRKHVAFPGGISITTSPGFSITV